MGAEHPTVDRDPNRHRDFAFSDPVVHHESGVEAIASGPDARLYDDGGSSRSPQRGDRSTDWWVDDGFLRCASFRPHPPMVGSGYRAISPRTQHPRTRLRLLDLRTRRADGVPMACPDPGVWNRG